MSPSVHQADPQSVTSIWNMTDTSSRAWTRPLQSQTLLVPTIGTFNSTGEGFLPGQAVAVGGTCSSDATATVLLSRNRSCCYCLVSHLLLKSCVMMPGSAKVEMSPRSWSFLAIFLNILLVIFPVMTAKKRKQESKSQDGLGWKGP